MVKRFAGIQPLKELIDGLLGLVFLIVADKSVKKVVACHRPADFKFLVVVLKLCEIDHLVPSLVRLTVNLEHHFIRFKSHSLDLTLKWEEIAFSSRVHLISEALPKSQRPGLEGRDLSPRLRPGLEGFTFPDAFSPNLCHPGRAERRAERRVSLARRACAALRPPAWGSSAICRELPSDPA